MKLTARRSHLTLRQIILLLALQGIYLNEAQAVDDDLFYDVLAVLSANKLERPVPAAAVGISVIDRNTIEAAGTITTSDILKLIPGMRAGYRGGEQASTDNYQILDLPATRNFKTSNTSGSVSLLVKNLLEDDRDYRAKSSSASAATILQSSLAHLYLKLKFQVTHTHQ